MQFANTLEKSVIQCVEEGFMTKDLSICIKGTNEYEIILIFSVARDTWVTTEGFINKVAEYLIKNLK